MRLSVLTINLNNLYGLRQTMESVFAQTFTDFEYIVVDGFSIDGSIELIQSFNSSVKPFKWISEPDTGVYQAMNKGIRIAQGEYILFLNSGDFFVNAKVLENVFSKNHNADILTGQCNILENGKVVHTTNPPLDITFGYLYNRGLNHQSTFIKKELFNKYGLYREDFKYNSDVEFWFRTIVLNGATTEMIPVVISDYNLDGISTLNSKSPEFKDELIRIYNNPIFQKFIPDYDAWNEERKSIKALYWLKSKGLLCLLLLKIYKFAIYYSNIKKRLNRMYNILICKY